MASLDCETSRGAGLRACESCAALLNAAAAKPAAAWSIAGTGYHASMTGRNVRAFSCFAILLAAALPAFAQLSSSSLQGAYNFRYLGASLGTQSAPCNDCPVSFIGTVTFDGKGNYQIAGQGNSINSGGSSQTLTPATSGTYTVFSSGMFYMDNPFAPAGTSTVLYGGIGQGVVVASSTESNNLDTFVAFPAATSASNATLSGAYQVGSISFPGGNINSVSSTLFSLTADGKGNLGSVSIIGTSPQLNSTTTTQTSSGATYSITANGSGTMTFPAPSGGSSTNSLLSGTLNAYVSADGNIFVAGTPTGYDLVIGIKAMPSGAAIPPVSGSYFVTELEDYYTTAGGPSIAGYWGSTNELGDANGTELVHLRTDSDANSSPYDWTYQDSYTFNASGVGGTFGSYPLAAGGNGNLFLVSGATVNGGFDHLFGVGVKVQPITGKGVFVSPYGVVNAASSAPFTAQLSPGEVITLYGSGMAPAGTSATSSAPFPSSLAGVSVTINNTPAPVYFVSPTQISVVVPYSLDPNSTYTANIQVTNGTASNTVTEYLGFTSPGVFTVPPGGIGAGAILHPNSPNLVTASSPAKIGETVEIFLTGLGPVSPSVNAGAAAPSSQPFAQPVNMPNVYLQDSTGNYTQATVTFAGLAPGLGGLYQVNATIPSGVAAGTCYIEVDGMNTSGLDATTIQATITVSQ